MIDWVESGGPKVKPPSRKGFGTTIIEHSVPYDLGGTATIDFAPEGLRARFVVPAKHIAKATKETLRPIDFNPLPQTHVPTRGDLLLGQRILLVEDSLIIALDAEDILRRLGAEAVYTEGTVAGAIATIETQKPTMAILDINLGDSNSFPIADRLADVGIPFLFATGYGEQSKLPDQHMARIVIQKPYTLATMTRRLPELFGETAA